MKTLSVILIYCMLWLIETGLPSEQWDDIALTNQKEIVEVIG